MTWKRDDLPGELWVRQQLAALLGLPAEFSGNKKERFNEVSEALYRLSVACEGLSGQISDLSDNYLKASSADDDDDDTVMRILRNHEGVLETLASAMSDLSEAWQK